MSSDLQINGSTFVSIKEAAKAVTYSRDYVTRLAREEKIIASQIGRQWFVDLESLKNFVEASALEHEVRKQILSTKRKQDLKVKQELDVLRGRVDDKNKKTHRHSLVTVLAVLCIGIFSGIALYENTDKTTFLIPMPFVPQALSEEVATMAPVTENTEVRSVPRVVTYLPVNASKEVAGVKGENFEVPIFKDESETRVLKNVSNGIIVLSEGQDAKNEEQIKAIFSDDVSVEFVNENEGVVSMEGDGEVRKLPFVSVPTTQISTTESES